jgi:AcrR family transcriptional regulator
VFAENGYTGATVADIAVRAGIGKGTIYEYFSSKEDLLFAVFEWFKLQTGAAAKVNIAALEGSAAKRLGALSESLMGIWKEIEDAFTLTMEFWAASSSSQLRDRFKENFRIMYQKFRGIVEPLVHEGKKVYLVKSLPKPNAPVVWGMQKLKIREDFIWLSEVFFDEDLKPVKAVKMLEIQNSLRLEPEPIGTEASIFASSMKRFSQIQCSRRIYPARQRHSHPATG